MPFRFWRDPLFIAAMTIYIVNRLWLKPYCVQPALPTISSQSASVHGWVQTNSWVTNFVHGHLNDLICIPLFVPLVVYLARLLGLRRHDRAPQAAEILLPLFVWSVMFELALPQHPYWQRWVVGDPMDVLWYCIGALVGWLGWRSIYPELPLERTPSDGSLGGAQRLGSRSL